MPEPITVPARADLDSKMPQAAFDRLLNWLRDNRVDPWRTTAERDLTISDDTIDRWDVVGGEVGEGVVRGHRRDANYELQDFEEWTTDDEFAIAIHRVTSPITVPLPDELRAALLAALA